MEKKYYYIAGTGGTYATLMMFVIWLAGFGVAGYRGYLYFADRQPESEWVWMLLAGLVVLRMLALWREPRRLCMTDDELILDCKVVGTVRLDFREIDSAELVAGELPLSYMWRPRRAVLHDSEGSFHSFAMDQDQCFWIYTKAGERFLFSAPKRDELVDKINWRRARFAGGGY